MWIPDHLYITKNKYFVLLLVELYDLYYLAAVLCACAPAHLELTDDGSCFKFYLMMAYVLKALSLKISSPWLFRGICSSLSPEQESSCKSLSYERGFKGSLFL